MSDADAAVSAAYQKLRLGDGDGADEILGPVLAAHPAHAGALQAMGLIRQAQQRLPEAARLIRAAIAQAPGKAGYHSNLGVVLECQGALAEAAEAFRTALALDTSLLGARANLARCLMLAGEVEEAVCQARALVKADATPTSWDLLASTQRAAEDFSSALYASEQALAQAPKAAPLRHARALALEGLGRESEALNEWERLASEGASSPELSAHLARALHAMDRTSEAEIMLSEATQRWPDRLALHGQLARMLWLGGADAEFIAPMQAALAGRPGDSALRAETAQLLIYAGAPERAEQLLCSAPVRDLAVTKMLAAALSAQQRLQEALAVIEPYPSLALRGDRAVLLLRLGRADEALGELRSCPRRPGADQHLVALEAIAQRACGDASYRRLYDYDRLVRTYDVGSPTGDAAAFNAALATSLRALHLAHAHPLDQTLRNGGQTGRDLRFVDDPTIKTFLAALDSPIRDYIGAIDADGPLGARRREGYRISGAWSVRLQPGGYHLNHVHDRGWISSAYYVDLPRQTTSGETQAGWLKFGEPPWPTPGLGGAPLKPEKIIQPRVGMLVLFPSYLWHGTIPFTGGEDRLTAAFDVVPV